jgi:hypothetical protein
LASVTVAGTGHIVELGSDAFNGTNNCKIYVPAALLAAYKSAPGWSGYADRIEAIN